MDETGFEPATLSLQGRRSPGLSYTPTIEYTTRDDDFSSRVTVNYAALAAGAAVVRALAARPAAGARRRR